MRILVWATVIAVLIGLLSPNGVAQQQRLPGEPTKEAAKAFSEGIEAYDKGDYNSALNSFTTAIKLDPTYSDAYYHRALVYDEVLWLSAEPSATSDYTLAIKFNPANADAYLRRGMRNRSRSAIDDFNSAIEIRPDFAEAYYRRGVARSQQSINWLRRIRSGEFKADQLKYNTNELGTDSQKMEEVIAHLTSEVRSAIPDLIKSIELNPKYVEAYSQLATVYLALGEHDKAVAESTHVLALSPDNAGAYYLRGLANLELKQDEKANQDFTEVIRLRPDYTRAYSKRVVARFNLKNVDGALEDYGAALRLKSNELRSLDDDEIEIGDTKIVPIELENFNQMSPSLAQTDRASLADAYYRRALADLYSWSPNEEEQRKAIADLTRAIIIHPAHVAARYERGLALCALELHAAAIRAFSDVIRLQPQNAEAYYARGIALHKLRLNRRALQDFSRSIELSPKFTRAYFERARVYSELGDQREAIADSTRAIAIHSEFVDAYYLRGLAHDQLGRYQQAIADYVEAARLAYLNDKSESDNTQQLGSKLAAVFHRGVARLSLARLLDKHGPGFLARSEEFAKKFYVESAEKDFTQVISARPKFASAYCQRGHAREIQRINKYFGKGASHYTSKEGALADFTKAIEVDPRYINAYFSRGAQFDEAYKPAEAIRDYTRVIELDPANAEAFYKLGNNYERGMENKPADLNAALENYSLAIKADPGYVAAYFRRAYLLHEKEPLRALADYSQIIQLDPENVKAYRSRAALHQQLKDYRSALADYTRAIELDPSEPRSNHRDAAITYADRAYVRFELGDGKGALEDYRHALIIRPCLYCTSGSGSVSQANKADAYLQKGLALLRRGDKQASRQNLEEAARLFYTQGNMPKYQSVKYHLSQF